MVGHPPCGAPHRKDTPSRRRRRRAGPAPIHASAGRLSLPSGRRYDARRPDRSGIWAPGGRRRRPARPGDHSMSVDILVFGPHPDDAEIGAGGLLRKMKALGHTTGVIDMTTGDMGWGTPEIRATESAAAARVLGLDVRENLDLGDCRVEDTFENRCLVAAAIRRHRPQIILAPYYNLPIGRGLGHNDHYKTGQIVANAYNLSHLRKAPIEGEPYQARALYFYFIPPGTAPTFIVDITDHFERMIAAI